EVGQYTLPLFGPGHLGLGAAFGKHDVQPRAGHQSRARAPYMAIGITDDAVATRKHLRGIEVREGRAQGFERGSPSRMAMDESRPELAPEVGEALALPRDALGRLQKPPLRDVEALRRALEDAVHVAGKAPLGARKVLQQRLAVRARGSRCRRRRGR